jgi:benzoylformate decarboxylase
VPRAILRAVLVALEQPCGPTFVSIPVDDWDRSCDPVAVRHVHAGRMPEPSAIAACAAALAAARSPAIIVGAGAARDGAWDQVIALAERHSAPVWVSPLSAQCSFPEDHRLFAGFLPAGRAAIVAALMPHDIALALGGPINLYHTEGTGPHLPPGCEAWLIGDNPAHAMWAPEGTAIVANVRAAIEQLLAGPAPAPRALPTQRPAPPALPLGVMTDAWLLSRIAALRPARSIVVEEAASSRGAMHDHLPILTPRSFYTTASGGLGYGLPAAIGTALARPGERVIAVLGDGAAMYAIQGLHTAAELGLPVSFVIIKNGRYEALHQFRSHFALQTLVGTDLGHLDFVRLAEAQGVPARSAADAASLDAALAWSFAAAGPTLVEAVVA